MSTAIVAIIWIDIVQITTVSRVYIMYPRHCCDLYNTDPYLDLHCIDHNSVEGTYHVPSSLF